jgi:hypothetical protein
VALAAASISPTTAPGCETIVTWLEAISTISAHPGEYSLGVRRDRLVVSSHRGRLTALDPRGQPPFTEPALAASAPAAREQHQVHRKDAAEYGPC